jgi:hypothetical protein
MDFLQLVQTVGTVIGSGAVVVAAQAFRHGKKQETIAFEDALAREYREITGALPAAAFFNEGVAQLTPREQQAMFRYFDLSNEQLRLIDAKGGRIDEGTAEVWTAGICELMKLPTFTASWSELNPRLPGDFFTSLDAAMSGYGKDLAQEGSSKATHSASTQSLSPSSRTSGGEPRPG